MSHGMSEEEVKKRLYGETDKVTLPGEPAQRGKAAPVKTIRKPLHIKAVFVSGAIAIAILCIFILVLSRFKAAPPPGTDAVQIRGYLIQGKKYYNDGLFDEAIMTWENVLKISSDHPTALRYIQRAKLKKKELKIREEETARRLKEMLARREQEEKERALRDKVQRLFAEGDALYKKGDFAGAVSVYQKVLNLSPGNRSAVKRLTLAEKKIASKAGDKITGEKEEKTVREPEAPPREAQAVYTVQVATFSDVKRAEDLAAVLTGKGYKGVNVRKNVSSKSGRIWYFVHLGSFETKEDARETLEKIRKEYADSFIKTLK